MTNNERLLKDPEAERVHGEGLDQVDAKKYDEAHKSFAQARSLIETAIRTRKHGLLPLSDMSIQVARIVRDDGFAYVREAAATKNPRLLRAANEQLEESVETTHILVGGMRGTMGGASEAFESRQREILAEHGATLGLIGRTATVDALFNGERDEESIGNMMAYYENADEFLQQGDNGYYLVSNAMAAARQKYIDNRDTMPWLKRAARGLARTAIHDRSNLKAAVRTFAGRMRHLQSYQTAVDSISEKP